MNRIILLVFILAISLKVAGQYTPGTAPVQYEKGYIYLKDGSVLKGKYLYSSSLDKVRVISGKNSWIFNSGDVEKISVKRPLLSFEENTGFDASPGTTVPVPVWFSLMEIGVLAGNDDNNRPAPLVFGASLNRRIWKNLSAGAGIGAEFLNETYMPVTANLMYRLRQSRFTPFAMLQSGYQIPIEESRTVYYRVVPDYIYSSVIWPGPWPSYNSEMKAKGGLLLNPTVGFLMQNHSGFGMSLAFGYRFHRLRYTAENDYRIDVDYNRLSLKLGFIFN